jgi:outer membrane protein
LNIVGTAGQSSTSISSTAVNNTASDSINRTIGLQLAIPLYAGGNVSSLVRQGVANREKAQQDLESTRRTAALSARQSYVGVTNGRAQVRALEAALVSSRSALDSNKLGYEVGVRINIDVLNAQQQVFSTLRDLSRARYDTILNGLRLKAASGNLGEADVEEVNRLLGTN